MTMSTGPAPRSRVQAAEPVDGGHPLDRHHVGRDPEVHPVALRHGGHVLERMHHDALEPLVHGLLVPEVAAPVLHPLEVADGDAAGVGEDVGDYEDALLVEDTIGSGAGGPVGALADD